VINLKEQLRVYSNHNRFQVSRLDGKDIKINRLEDKSDRSLSAKDQKSVSPTYNIKKTTPASKTKQIAYPAAKIKSNLYLKQDNHIYHKQDNHIYHKQENHIYHKQENYIYSKQSNTPPKT